MNIFRMAKLSAAYWRAAFSASESATVSSGFVLQELNKLAENVLQPNWSL